MSKLVPFFGFVDIEISNCPEFVMFSNNDDYVAKKYFWNGRDAYEPMSLQLWLRLAKSKAVIFDVGSYTGLYSLAAAITYPKCKVIAFEPIELIYSRLLINKMSNNLGNMTVRNIALSDKTRLIYMNVFNGDTVLSTGSTIMEGAKKRPVHQRKKVKSSTISQQLAELNLKSLDLIKIDAEGAEHLVLKGGVNY